MSDLSDQRRYYERMIDEIANAHREQLDQLKAENAKLRQELEVVGTAAYLYGRNDLADENAKLRKKVQRQADELTALRKAIEQRNSELRPWKRQVERFVAENAKLRALVESYGMIANEAVCDYYDRDEMLVDANATACELGIEVPDV